MVGLWTVLNTGKSGLATSQYAIKTVSHNIANVNTPGYSRQRAILEARDPMMRRPGQIGQGVDVLTVDRLDSRYIHRQMVDNQAELGFNERSYKALKSAEAIFSDSTQADIQSAMVNFFDGFKLLSERPDDLALRENMRRRAVSLTDRFHRVKGDLEDLQSEMNPEIDGMVKKVNILSQEIADLNREIAIQEFKGDQANDLRDRQEQKVRELSKIVEVKTYTDNRGFLNVAIDHGEPLVSGKKAYRLAVSDDALTRIRVERADGTFVDVTDELGKGELAGIIEVRDTVIEGYKDRVDSLATTMATEVNRIHNNATNPDGSYTLVHDPASPAPPDDAAQVLGGGDFFDTLIVGDPIDASTITVHMDILNDPMRIAVSQSQNYHSAQGDNRNAITMTGLATVEGFFAGSSETLTSHYQNTVGNVGHDVVKSKSSLEFSTKEATQLENFRETLVGVNMDEELIDLNRFKKAYEASSRVIQTADDMLETILNLKR